MASRALCIDVNRLRRRPPGSRVLVYLDQSALSEFASSPGQFSEELAYLREAVGQGRVVCLRSAAHREETSLAPVDLWDKIDRLSGELSVGIEFESVSHTMWTEVHSAAACFLKGDIVGQPRWQEAFSSDPHEPNGDRFVEVFGQPIQVRARFEPTEAERAAVKRRKSIESDRMSGIYTSQRDADLSYATVASQWLDIVLRSKLGPLSDPPRFQRELRQWYADFMAAGNTADGSDPASTRLRWAAELDLQAQNLVTRYPDLAYRLGEFVASDQLRHMPSLGFPALLRAGIATTPRRKAKPGDGYDIDHLAQGLSRCDVVTADAGMKQLCRDHRIIPSGVGLLSTRELHDLPTTIDALLAKHPPLD
jgi:hypothetical protein